MSKRVHFSKQGLKGKGLARVGTSRKKGETRTRKKPEWDDSIKDLKVHKLSREELERRHRSAQSKNADAARHDLYERARGGLDLDSSGNLRPSPLAATASSSKFTSLQRALHGKELHEVLAESDRALAVVKDIFGDDPKRYIGQPNVTIAPHVVTNKRMFERTILESQLDGPSPTALASPGGIRDESIVEMVPKKPALNDLPSPPEFTLDDSDATLTPEADHNGGYQPAIDLGRFRKVLHLQETPEPKTTRLVHPQAHSEGLTTVLDGGIGLVDQETQTLNGERKEREKAPSIASELSSIPVDSSAGQLQSGGTVDSEVSSSPDLQPHGSVNETTGERTTTLQLVNGEPPPLRAVMSPLEGSNNGVWRKGSGHQMASRGHQMASRGPDDLQVLEKLVQDLESQLVDYEQETGYKFSVKKPTVSQGTFSSITASLLASVTKLTHYLKQSEVQLKGEVAVRGQLLHTMAEQQNLMDALTTDMVKLQEENLTLQTKLEEVEKTTTVQTMKLQEELSEVHKKLSSLPLGGTYPLVLYQQPPGSGYHIPPATLSESSHHQLPLLESQHLATSGHVSSSTYLPTSSMTEQQWPSFSAYLPTSSMTEQQRPSLSTYLPTSSMTGQQRPSFSTYLPTSTTSSMTEQQWPSLSTYLPTSSMTEQQRPSFSAFPTTLKVPSDHHMNLEHASQNSSLPSSTITLSQAAVTTHTTYTTPLPVLGSIPNVPPSSGGVVYAQVSPLSISGGIMLPPARFDSSLSRSSAAVGLPSHPLHTGSHYYPLSFMTPTSSPASTSNMTVSSPTEYAPSPPPLSIALEVPSLSSFLNTTPATSTYTLMKSGSVVSSRPSFGISGSLTSHHSSQEHWLPKHGDRPKPSLQSVDLSLSSLIETDVADSTSFLDVKSSVEQMSTLAKSVLQELSHQQQQTEINPQVSDLSITTDSSDVSVPEFVKSKGSFTSLRTASEGLLTQQASVCAALPTDGVVSLPLLDLKAPITQAAPPTTTVIPYLLDPNTQTAPPSVMSLPLLYPDAPMTQATPPSVMSLPYLHNSSTLSQQLTSMERPVTTVPPGTNVMSLPRAILPDRPSLPKSFTLPTTVQPCSSPEYKATSGPKPGWFALSSHVSHQ